MLYQSIIINGQPAGADTFAPPTGCGVLYEVIRVTNGAFLFLGDHVNRLNHSARLAGVDLVLSVDDMRRQLNRLLQLNHVQTGNIKLEYYFLTGIIEYQAAFFIQHRYPPDEAYQTGVLTSLFRAKRTNPNAKIIQPQLTAQIDQVIAEKKVYEVILVHPDGYITEGARSTIFMVKESKVYTAPEADVLPGITRKYVLRICDELSIPLVETRMPADQLPKMEAVFIAGTSPKILPVAFVDELPFNPGNATIRRIMKRYDELAGL